MRRAALAALLLIFLASCAGHRYALTDGPIRLSAKADTFFAHTDKPWTWWLIVEGALDEYKDEEIALVFTTFKREEFPTVSVFTGLHRISHFSSTFDQEYYLHITGKAPWTNDDQFWSRNVEPDQMEQEPIDGWESTFDGKFWIKVDLWTVDVHEPAIQRLELGKLLGSTYVRGRLDCLSCRI